MPRLIVSITSTGSRNGRVVGGVHSLPGWLWGIVVVVLLLSHSLHHSGAAAAERPHPIRIGALTASWGPTPQVVGLRDGLLELGYRESEQFVLGVRFTQGDTAVLPATARELVQYGVDILIADTDESIKALRLATTQIPIVFVAVSDPVRLGLVQSFARPGGNITGVADLGSELGPKRLQVFREIVPTLQRVLYLYDANDAEAHAAGEIYRHTAQRLGVALIEQAVQTEEEARALLAQVRKEDVDGILAPPSLSLNITGAILEAATHRAIPTMFSAHGTFFVEEGGLASFGADAYAAGREAARLVDKILKGGAPAEIPVEVTTQIELTINLKTAKALDLTIPPEVLYRADRLVR